MSGIFRRVLSFMPFGVLVAAVVLTGMALNSQPPSVGAQAPPQICRATMILDRSGSIDGSEMNRMRSQIRRLFEPTGIYNDKIQLAFWTFSNDVGANYNSPFHDFVSSRGVNSSFNSRLNAINSGGNTNYQQAFAYNGDTRNPALNDIIEASDILVFMTDGEPNSPPGGIFGGLTPEESGRQAALKHLNAGRVIIGGSIGSSDAQRRVINYVVSGDRNNYNSSFVISGNFDDLAVKLKEQIDKKCKELFPPCQYNPNLPADSPDCKPPESAPYSLTPSVTASNTVISGSDSAGFIYKVDNDSTGATSDPTHWSVKRLVVDRGQAVEPLYYTPAEAYRDGYSCNSLKALVGGRATCDDAAASGTRTFGPGSTTLTPAELGSVATTTVDDSWQVGTKLCYVLVIDKPTQKNTPVDRFSRAACVVVGKRPTVQVHGGDLVVGRYFKAGDISETSSANVRGSLTTKSGSINKTFGSWVEYGIFAPGIVSGVASASGLSGGYDGAVASNPDLWSRLTFANTQGEYGHFTTPNNMGQVTNTAEYFLRGRSVARDLAAVSDLTINGANATSGLYRKATGDLAIDASTLEKGKLVIVHVPEGTVTIRGNLGYVAGPYGAIGEIPQLVIIAKNIVINGNVTNVDAWLLAQAGDGSGGMISTCEFAGTLTSEVCNAPLTVNGPVMAKDLQLKRTGGAGVGNASGDPAEIFNLRADAYLWSYGEGRSSVRAQTTHTTELPPQF